MHACVRSSPAPSSSAVERAAALVALQHDMRAQPGVSPTRVACTVAAEPQQRVCNPHRTHTLAVPATPLELEGPLPAAAAAAASVVDVAAVGCCCCCCAPDGCCSCPCWCSTVDVWLDDMAARYAPHAILKDNPLHGSHAVSAQTAKTCPGGSLWLVVHREVCVHVCPTQ